MFFELVSRNETPVGPRFRDYAEIGERLGISKQAVQKRLQGPGDRHPAVGRLRPGHP